MGEKPLKMNGQKLLKTENIENQKFLEHLEYIEHLEHIAISHQVSWVSAFPNYEFIDEEYFHLYNKKCNK